MGGANDPFSVEINDESDSPDAFALVRDNVELLGSEIIVKDMGCREGEEGYA